MSRGISIFFRRCRKKGNGPSASYIRQGRATLRFAQRNLQSKLKEGLEADTFPISSFAHRPPPCHPERSAAESKDLEAALDVASCLFQPQAFVFRDPSTRSLAPSVRMTARGTVSIRRQAATFHSVACSLGQDDSKGDRFDPPPGGCLCSPRVNFARQSRI